MAARDRTLSSCQGISGVEPAYVSMPSLAADQFLALVVGAGGDLAFRAYRAPPARSSMLLTLAAHAGPDITVDLDYEALAAKTGMTLQEATAAVERLLQRGDLQPAGEGWVAVSLNGAAR
jgi:hypothetical protein